MINFFKHVNYIVINFIKAFYLNLLNKFDSNKKTLFLWDNSTSTINSRIILILCCFGICFLILMYRILVITIQGVEKTKPITYNNFHYRNNIVDRNGVLLAVNLPSASLFVNLKKAVNLEESISKLSKELNIESKKLFSKLNTNKNFVWIKRDLSPKQQEMIFNLGIPGFDFIYEQKRVYAFSNLLSHVIGYVDRDGTGLSGIEKYCDNILTVDNKLSNTENNFLNNNLELSIDVRLQNIVNEELSNAIAKFSAIGGVGIVVNPNNGEILSLVSKPDYNPHYPSKFNANQLFNMASLGSIEMGSVFKSITMAIGFDTKTIDINDAYDISYMRVGGFQVKDLHPRKGWHSVSEIFLYSSNIGVSQIMLEIGKENLKIYLQKLKLLDQLNVELSERSTPLFQPYSKWNDLSLVTMSYGYALSISPLHFVQSILPMLNGGYLYPLSLIKNNYKNHQGIKVFHEDTSKKMKKLFRLVVQNGTGRKAEVPGYLVGGKTGTAEKLSGKKYVRNSRRSTFIATFPVSNPQYVIYIMLDDPKGIKETFGFASGGWTAAPVVGSIIKRMIALYGLTPVNIEDKSVQEFLNLDYKINHAV